MDSLRFRGVAVILGIALIGTVACGGSDGRSPASPTPTESGTPNAPSPTPAGATVTGTISSGGIATIRLLGGLRGIKISVSGTDLSTTTDANGGFQLRGVPPGLVRLLFEGPGASGSLDLEDVSQTEQISLSLVVSGSTIELAEQERITGSQAQLEGKVVSANYAARTLVVGTTTVAVPESASITNGFRQLELQDVIVGARIHVKGSMSGDAITATTLIVQQTGLDRVTESGVVSDVSGGCPDVSFKFGSLGLAVNGSTIFVQGTCDALKSGVNAEAKGLRRTDGSVLVTMLKFKSTKGDKTVEFSGVISALSGTCPARKFQAGGRDVQTNGATTFLTPCATLANGLTVEIKGKDAGGKVTASQVK